MATKKHNPHAAQSFDAVLGTRIRAARNQCSISQQELGAKLGVSFQQIQKYEQGRNRVSCVAIIKIAEALSQPISYFLDEAPFKPNSKAEELAKFAAGHMGTALAEAMVQIPREQQDAVLALARALAKGA